MNGISIKTYFDLYKITKVGLINENKRMCACGQELIETDKTCPNCGTEIKKTLLLNVAKNNALGKRYETIKDLNMVYFKYYHLLSSGFELNETEMLTIAINLMTSEVKISDLKMFKSLNLANNIGMEEFFNTEFPGFKEFVYKCLGEQRYDMAISNFGSLDDGKLTNFMNVYLNYKALIPYIRGYKILNQGRKVNLKKYYPDVNFNNEDEVKATKLNLDLLLSWDLKNEKYLESIIETNSDKIKNIDAGDNNIITIPLNIYFKMNSLDNNQNGLNYKYLDLNNSKSTVKHIKKVKFFLENEAENRPFIFNIKFNINRSKVILKKITQAINTQIK
jgi:hypothetical protein